MIVVFPADARSRVATLNAQKAVLATHDGQAAVAELKRKFGAEETRLSAEQREIEGLRRHLDGDASLKDRIDTLSARHGRAAAELQRKVEESRCGS